MSAPAVASHTPLRRPQNGDFGAKAKEPFGHRFAQPGAAAGNEDFFARKQTIDEH
jgi:hypothetical protein